MNIDEPPILPDVFPKESVDINTESPPILPDVFPKESVDKNTDSPPMLPVMLPNESVDKDNVSALTTVVNVRLITKIPKYFNKFIT